MDSYARMEEVSRPKNGTLSILDVEVSCFSSYTCPERPINVNLLDWLRSNTFKDAVLKIRKCPKTEQRRLKSALPAITPSGLFSRRSADALIQHSSLIQFDIDFQDNSHITNFDQLKLEISNIKNVAYCGLSVSGNGFWGLVPITNADKHLQHFETLCKAFLRLGISLDQKPKNVASLRGYSWDENAYFNHTAIPLQLYESPPILKQHFDCSNPGKSFQDVMQLAQIIESRLLDITQDYKAWFSIGCGLANTFGEDGRDLFHRISQFNQKYTVRKTDYQFDQCLRHNYGYTIGTIFFYCKQNGLDIKEILSPNTFQQGVR